MYKIFEGETLQQALFKMKIDLGADAILVEHKVIKKGGVFGLFSKDVYVVKAMSADELKSTSFNKKKRNYNVKDNSTSNSYNNSRNTSYSDNFSNNTPNNSDILNNSSFNKNEYLRKIQSAINEKNKSQSQSSQNQNQTSNKKSKFNHVIDDEVSPVIKSNINKDNNKGVYSPYSKKTASLSITDELNKNNLLDKSTISTQNNKKQNTIKTKNSGIIKRDSLNDKSNDDELSREIQVLKDELKSISSTMGVVLDKIKNDDSKYSGLLTKYYYFLIENEFEEEVAEKIIENVSNRIDKTRCDNNKIVRHEVSAEIKKILRIPKPVNSDSNIKIFTVIGPTGVGKTTTLAKLGAYLTLEEEKNIAFLTLDTYRLAAVEQLKKYASVLGVPMKVVYMPEEVNESIMCFLKKDLILIDTAGRSPFDELQMKELFDFVKSSKFSMEIALTISATTKYSDLVEIVDKFSLVDFDQFIITKIDETVNLGQLISIIDKYKKPVSFIANGQDVPDHFEIFQPQLFIDLLFNKFSLNENVQLG